MPKNLKLRSQLFNVSDFPNLPSYCPLKKLKGLSHSPKRFVHLVGAAKVKYYFVLLSLEKTPCQRT